MNTTAAMCRQKLIESGVSSLSDSELLSVILRQRPPDSVNGLLKALDQMNGAATPDALVKSGELRSAEACALLAAMEFSRRRIRPEGLKITFPSDIMPLISHLGDRKQEHFVCVSLNGANEVIASRVITVGLVNASQVHPREVFADPITDRACAVIVAHNHPSGALAPSKEDIEVTKRLKLAGETIGIKVIDHIVFNRKGFFSMLENGIL